MYDMPLQVGTRLLGCQRLPCCKAILPGIRLPSCLTSAETCVWRLPPLQDMLKFGNSSREYVLVKEK